MEMHPAPEFRWIGVEVGCLECSFTSSSDPEVVLFEDEASAYSWASKEMGGDSGRFVIDASAGVILPKSLLL